MKMREKNELLQSMERCGHYLYHRRGGKRGQGRILRILYQEGQLPQKTLQDMLGIRAGSMSEIIGKLESGGLLVRGKDTDDRRRITLRITDQGRKFVEDREREVNEKDERLFACLDPDEQEDLKRLLQKLLSSWEAEVSPEFWEHPPAKNHKGNGGHGI